MTNPLLLLFGNKNVAYAIPSNTSAPVVSGDAVDTGVLSCSNGGWTGGAITFTYQWRKAGVNISGATSSSYTVVTGDVGALIDCVVTATNSLGSASQDSNDVTPIALAAPSNTVAPVVSGDTSVGSVLSSTTGTWTGYFITYSYQWYRGASEISGATSYTYTTVTADAGSNVTCKVTATNATAAVSADSNAILIDGGSSLGTPLGLLLSITN